MAVIPEPRDRQGHRALRGSRGGRPVTYDTDAHRGRNVVERSFNALKHWRGLATRYDKLAVVHGGGAVLAAILAWLRSPPRSRRGFTTGQERRAGISTMAGERAVALSVLSA